MKCLRCNEAEAAGKGVYCLPCRKIVTKPSFIGKRGIIMADNTRYDHNTGKYK